MVNWLGKIIAGKREEIFRARSRAKAFRAQAESRTDFRDFAAAITRGSGPLRIIAEAKQASPSAGKITSKYDPALLARNYEASGASAISVLTEANYFLGGLDHLRAARAANGLPVLRKDFVVDEAQVLESAANNADAILLIVAALASKQLRYLHQCANALNLSVLVEVQTAEEIQIALDAGAKVIGINNRDLTTFEVDLDKTNRLLPHIPSGVTIVSESGIRDAADVAKMSNYPIDAVLIGEALMRADALVLSKILARI
jgi:Indole-3-glycerol phosphate synthase